MRRWMPFLVMAGVSLVGALCAWALLPRAHAAPEPVSQSGEDAAREAADRARTKVIILKTRRGASRGAATGFLARPRLVITAAHAVARGTSVTAWVNGVSYPAELVVSRPEHDLAVLALRAPELFLKPLELAETSTALSDREPLVILAGPSQPSGARGDPAGRVPLHAAYRDRSLVLMPGGERIVMLRLDGNVRQGDSGSPVLRVRDGAVVGVLSSRELPDLSGRSRSAFAVPVEVVRPWLEAAEKQQKLPRAAEEFYLFQGTKKSTPR